LYDHKKQIFISTGKPVEKDHDFMLLTTPGSTDTFVSTHSIQKLSNSQ